MYNFGESHKRMLVVNQTIDPFCPEMVEYNEDGLLCKLDFPRQVVFPVRSYLSCLLQTEAKSTLQLLS